MKRPRFHSQNSINFLILKTHLPAALVEMLSGIEIPSLWEEGIRTIIESYNRPGALELQEQMVEEREEFIRNLPSDELENLQEVTVVTEYLERLMNEGGVELGTAAIFANAVMEWHLRVEKAIIEALCEKK